MSVYPAVVLPMKKTLLCDSDLIEAVRIGCGDELAELIERRLEDAFTTKESISVLKEILSDLQGAIISAENAESALEDFLQKE